MNTVVFVQIRRQSHELVLQLTADERIKSRERFVHQQYCGVRCQRSGQADALLHAPRQFAREPILVTVEIDQV